MVKLFFKLWLTKLFIFVMAGFTPASISMKQFRAAYDWYYSREILKTKSEIIELSLSYYVLPGLTCQVAVINNKAFNPVLDFKAWGIHADLRKNNYYLTGSLQNGIELTDSTKKIYIINSLSGKYFWKNSIWHSLYWKKEERREQNAKDYVEVKYAVSFPLHPLNFKASLYYDRSFYYYVPDTDNNSYTLWGDITVRYKTPKLSMELWMEAKEHKYDYSAQGYKGNKYKYLIRSEPHKKLDWELAGTFYQYRGDNRKNADIFSINGNIKIKVNKTWEICGESLVRFGSGEWLNNHNPYWYPENLAGNIDIKWTSGAWMILLSPFWMKKYDAAVLTGVLTKLAYDRKPWKISINYSPKGYSYYTARKGLWGTLSWSIEEG